MKTVPEAAAAAAPSSTAPGGAKRALAGRMKSPWQARPVASVESHAVSHAEAESPHLGRRPRHAPHVAQRQALHQRAAVEEQKRRYHARLVPPAGRGDQSADGRSAGGGKRGAYRLGAAENRCLVALKLERGAVECCVGRPSTQTRARPAAHHPTTASPASPASPAHLDTSLHWSYSSMTLCLANTARTRARLACGFCRRERVSSHNGRERGAKRYKTATNGGGCIAWSYHQDSNSTQSRSKPRCQPAPTSAQSASSRLSASLHKQLQDSYKNSPCLNAAAFRRPPLRTATRGA